MKIRGIYFFFFPMVAAVFLAFILPYGAAFLSAFGDGKISLWKNPILFRVTFFTIKQAFFSVLLSLAIGLPGAWFAGGKSKRFRVLFRTLTSIPFAMPSILVVLGFVLFYGNSGWLNRALAAFPGKAGPLYILYKPQAIVLAHGFLNFPLVIRLVGDGVARARITYAPIAASLGASPLVTFFTVTLPLLFPALMSAMLLVFLYSFTSFAIVLVLGGGPASTTLPVEIYRHARIFLNYPNAGMLALIETSIALTVFIIYAYFARIASSARVEIRERVFESKRALPITIAMASYLFLSMVFILGPLVSLIFESLLARATRSADEFFSFRWWSTLGNTCLPAMFRSLVLAILSASTACFLALLAAAAVKITGVYGGGIPEKKKLFTERLINFFAISPLISSGIVLGFGWIIFYGRGLSRTPAALVVLHAVIALPFAYNSISEGFRSLPENILYASSVSGSNPLRCIFSVLIPLSRNRLLSAWSFAAALSLGELNAVMMLGIDNWETLPLYIYRAIGAYRYGLASSAGTLLMLCCTLCLLLSELGRGKHVS